ncbi:hypothetical protein NDU88_008803 [Pleurodeles waltl]|uniref:Uncharacterized protein n=1 Tax=Pleurodeles waltl TaxID=8319 RepID=A0AAV7QTV3_PLEWA|nr:hypothetical protein NDU88_008803 [Pleurodeles waltl]
MRAPLTLQVLQPQDAGSRGDLQLFRGPREALGPQSPAPHLEGPPRGRPVLRPRPRLAPLRGRIPTPGPSPAPPAGAVQLGPDWSRGARTPGGSLAMYGQPPGFPQAGRRTLSRAEAAERKQKRFIAPPSWTRPL